MRACMGKETAPQGRAADGTVQVLAARFACEGLQGLPGSALWRVQGAL